MTCRLPGGWGRLHQTQNTCHPPVAGHDDPADDPAAPVVIRPGVIPPQRLADPLAVGVATAALVAAHALVVQHGVDVHGALLALQTSLRADGEDRVYTLRAHIVMLYVLSGGERSFQTN